MSAELLGFDELMNDITALAGALTNGPGLNRALKAGAVPIVEQMKHNASKLLGVHTGDLLNSIKTGSVKTWRYGGKYITIGAHYGSRGYYGHMVEFGHGGPAPAPAHPFARPAFDTRKDDAYEEMRV
jgi:HK97 gp10 family phage protein